ncbi:hypothetical protein J6590_041445 [Homalodisca vitripennis]|nr:hypothetical protein J6590_041445 [Homalodisca vitripennis]
MRSIHFLQLTGHPRPTSVTFDTGTSRSLSTFFLSLYLHLTVPVHDSLGVLKPVLEPYLAPVRADVSLLCRGVIHVACWFKASHFDVLGHELLLQRASPGQASVPSLVKRVNNGPRVYLAFTLAHDALVKIIMETESTPKLASAAVRDGDRCGQDSLD